VRSSSIRITRVDEMVQPVLQWSNSDKRCSTSPLRREMCIQTYDGCFFFKKKE
jgi:hypothetical protein